MVILSLGTAQWGDPYGVTNQVGRLSDASLKDIVDTAVSLGIADLDTAPTYGDAESRLAPWAKDFRITTKVVGSSPMSLGAQLNASLNRLGCPVLDVCLVHDWPSLSSRESRRVAVELEELRSDGLVRHVGISAYVAEDVNRAQQAFTSLDRVQVPVNILDRRLLSNQLVHRAWESGTRFIARSVFLQGLLAADGGHEWEMHQDVRHFHEMCQSEGVSPMAAALDFVRNQPWISQITVGVTSASELSHLGKLWANAPRKNLPDCSSNDLNLIDPRRWR